MAPANAPKPGRLLGLAALVVVLLYAGMAAAGTWTPKLGLDLRGGTQVTLKPKVADGGGGKVTKSALNKAVDIIRQRVNGLGVAESEVSVEGSNIVISVPGKGRDEVVKLVGQTAQLRFRQVLQSAGTAPTTSPQSSATPKPSGSAAPSATTTVAPSPSASVKKRPLTRALLAAPSPTPKPSASPSAPASPVAGSIEQQFAALDCSLAKNREGTGSLDDPNKPMVACNREGTEKFILDKAAVLGTEIKSAEAGIDQQGLGAWQVNLTFKGKGTKQFGDLTTKAYKAGVGTPENRIAIVLDGVVQSAPQIANGPILGGQAQITGNFTQKDASDLANVLKYGALPLAFDQQQVTTVSATLGDDQLHAGLLAGAIGLILVIIYSLLYYRGLGLVTILSLGLAAVITYAAVVLLGNAIGFTLTLAGIAGLIVAVGITADSFVVYFERLRDEVREGRTLRSATERGWVRARRTILSADFVSILAAAVLYLLSVGSVRGFAFTLGLSTLIDIFVVFLFTKPLVTLLVRGRLFGSGRPWTGLAAGQLGATPRTEPESRRRSRTTPKEA